MQKIALLTCDRFPELYETDQKLIPVLKEYGYMAKAEIWDNPNVNWHQYDVLIFRNIWDYYLKIGTFNAWLDTIDNFSIRSFNPISVIRWNKHKFYLRELQAIGIPVIPGIYISRTNELNIEKLLPCDWTQAILKPAISAGSHLTTLFDTKDAASVSVNYHDIAKEQDLILQKFIPEICTEGEISLLFFDKKFSHAVVKKPKAGDFRIQSMFGGKYQAYSPTGSLLKMAQKIVDYIEHDLLYARVDGIIIDGTFHLMELELIEPDLYFDYVENGTMKFADNIHKFIRNKN